MKRVLLMLALLVMPSLAFAQKSTEDEAGDVSEVDKDSSGPLRDRIRPVTGHLFLMKGRFELSPGISISVKDAFFTKYVFGLSATYYFTESLGLSLRGGYALSVTSGAAQICVRDASGNASCRLPTDTELNGLDANGRTKAFGKIGLLAGLDLQWAPVYGKISLTAEKVIGFNMYAMAGPQLVQQGPNNALTVGGNVGLGMRFFFNRWLCLRTELRDVIYMEPNGPIGDSLRNQLMIDFGFSLFFPTTFTEG
ncbi:MAG: outer membrane beta-barrel domain-containing protein [Myxococcaceae bacterium]|nr:outer membrane beta-barrel domain-containing protein [Myxococcaceae bacterium]